MNCCMEASARLSERLVSLRMEFVWLGSNIKMLRKPCWRSGNDQEMLLMQVHCRRSLITVMADPLCQGNTMHSTILVGHCPHVLACCTRLACLRVGCRPLASRPSPDTPHGFPMLRASCRLFCKQAATTHSMGATTIALLMCLPKRSACCRQFIVNWAKLWPCWWVGRPWCRPRLATQDP